MNDPARTTTLAELRSHIWNLADAICAELTILHTDALDKHATRRLATYAASLARRTARPTPPSNPCKSARPTHSPTSPGPALPCPQHAAAA